MKELNESLVGHILGNYEIQRELGRGGMGVVYKAHEQSLQRVVALKVLPPNLAASDQFVKRFEREARAAASLSHPNIVTVYAVGRHGDYHYIAMEYVKGKTIDQVIRERGHVGGREAVEYVQQIADALAEANRKDVVHRDIKPQNIMIDEAGRVKVMDFGLAKVMSGATDLTSAGTYLGTPTYMSPEQCQGKDLDTRSDIYSLGVMFYEMLTGTVPFRADTPLAMMRMIIDEPMPTLTCSVLGLPEDLGNFLAKMTAKDRTVRYASGEALSADLRAWLRGDPTSVSVLADATVTLPKDLGLGEGDTMPAPTPAPAVSPPEDEPAATVPRAFEEIAARVRAANTPQADEEEEPVSREEPQESEVAPAPEPESVPVEVESPPVAAPIVEEPAATAPAPRIEPAATAPAPRIAPPVAPVAAPSSRSPIVGWFIAGAAVFVLVSALGGGAYLVFRPMPENGSDVVAPSPNTAETNEQLGDDRGAADEPSAVLPVEEPMPSGIDTIPVTMGEVRAAEGEATGYREQLTARESELDSDELADADSAFASGREQLEADELHEALTSFQDAARRYDALLAALPEAAPEESAPADVEMAEDGEADSLPEDDASATATMEEPGEPAAEEREPEVTAADAAPKEEEEPAAMSGAGGSAAAPAASAQPEAAASPEPEPEPAAPEESEPVEMPRPEPKPEPEPEPQPQPAPRRNVEPVPSDPPAAAKEPAMDPAPTPPPAETKSAAPAPAAPQAAEEPAAPQDAPVESEPVPPAAEPEMNTPPPPAEEKEPPATAPAPPAPAEDSKPDESDTKRKTPRRALRPG